MELIRYATRADADGLDDLDRRCFPPDHANGHGAAPGEFAFGIDRQRILVTVADDGLIGFLQWDVLGEDGSSSLLISSVGVHPAHQGTGVARRLIERFLQIHEDTVGRDAVRQGATVQVVTSPRNGPMINTLTRAGFVGTMVLPSFYGEGRDRLRLEHRPETSYTRCVGRTVVPIDATEAVTSLLDAEHNVVVGVVALSQGWHLEIAERHEPDVTTTMTTELSTGVSFAGTMVATMAFLFGVTLLDLENRTIGADLTAAVGACLLLSVLSLITYANASGDVARLAEGRFHRFMEIGNLWSEMGSVYPLFALTPILVTTVNGGHGAAVALGVLATVMMAAYHLTPMPILNRYRTHGRTWWGIRVMQTVLPVAGPLVVITADTSTPWTVAFAATTILGLVLGSITNER